MAASSETIRPKLTSMSISVMEENTEKKVDVNSFEKLWMIMPCRAYEVIYTDCKNWRSKLYSRYRGENPMDCDAMEKDYNMCMDLAYNNSPIAYEYLIKREEEKRYNRMMSMKNNDVWEYRTSPPKDWDEEIDRADKDEERALFKMLGISKDQNDNSDRKKLETKDKVLSKQVDKPVESDSLQSGDNSAPPAKVSHPEVTMSQNVSPKAWLIPTAEKTSCVIS